MPRKREARPGLTLTLTLTLLLTLTLTLTLTLSLGFTLTTDHCPPHPHQARITTFPHDDPEDTRFSADLVPWAKRAGYYPAHADAAAFDFSAAFNPISFHGARYGEVRPPHRPRNLVRGGILPSLPPLPPLHTHAPLTTHHSLLTAHCSPRTRCACGTSSVASSPPSS